jgi:hypothetical protein
LNWREFAVSDWKEIARQAAGEGQDAGFQGAAYLGLSDGLEPDVGAAAVAPGTCDGHENGGMSLDEHLLLARGVSLTYGKVLVGAFERREDFSCHPKIRMLHIEEQDLVCQRFAVGAVLAVEPRLACQGTPFGGETGKGTGV